MAKAKKITVSCEASVSEGASAVLLTRADEMFSFRADALDWSRPKGVHDMRVASRRLRSALKDFRRHLPKELLRGPRKRIKQLADALGDVRDGDVALALLAKMAEQAPPELAPGLAPLAEVRRERREAARAALALALSEDELDALQEELRVALARPDLRGPADSTADSTADEAAAGAQAEGERGESGAARAEVSFGDAGREIISKQLDELSELSAGLFRPTDSEALHDLRIAAKRLRYALELFSICLGDSLKPFAKEIAALQDSLGAVHDCDVWIGYLGGRLSEPHGEKVEGQPPAPPAVSTERRAALWLLRLLARRRAESYEDALARWHAWECYGLLPHLSERVRAHTQTLSQSSGDGDQPTPPAAGEQPALANRDPRV